ncbi:unnamed protein product [Diatraea saccharalis]|uniref:Uncharacterized protein n=1 Tax=Diatraea saccharalis TaxID=40085 RepID=A0A9P0C884_9NEOP|nr:unnamed protein product [Diatraea saccharalis]
MYRSVAVFICMSFVSAAPQDSSDFNYVNPSSEPRQIQFDLPNESLEVSTTSRDNLYKEFTNTETTGIDSKEINNAQSTDNQQYTKISTPYLTTVETTDKIYAPEISSTTEVPPKKLPSQRFISKLGYFKNSEKFGASGQINFIERTGKRKFKSRCRCEKITNCPKLQITVPRCPEEYFLCCF